jgi:hypothetical protein
MKLRDVKGGLALSLLLFAVGCGGSSSSSTDTTTPGGGTGTTTGGGGGNGSGGSTTGTGTGGTTAAGGQSHGGNGTGGHATGGHAAGGNGTGGNTTTTGCSDDKQCGGNTPFCDKASKTCVACVDEAQCPDGQVCKANACVPGCSKTKPICGDAGTCDVATGQCSLCKADGDCADPANPRCDVGTGRCVACLPDNDNCGQGKYCVELNGNYSCNSGCAKDADCKAGLDGGGAANLACCNHVCIDTAADTKNCGTCGNTCAQGSLCCTGACVDPTNDVNNCSACGKACSATHATVSCDQSACAVKACDQGFADCDKAEENGCEVDTTSDPNNCSACGQACSIANGVAGCAGSACTIASCNDGFADCDKTAANGCEVTTLSDVKNCGACGNDCGVPANGTASCGSGKCTVTCAPGFLDCDGDFKNGCEVDGTKDPSNCGACGAICGAVANGSAACAAGVCGIGSCNNGFFDCDKNAVNGCEVDGSKDLNNCGACGKVCGAVANGSAACSAGVCGVGSCTQGFADCDKNASNGCEVNTQTDTKNCNTCGNVCPGVPGGAPACNAGVCGVGQCVAPQKDCDGNAANGCEVNLSTDAKNCGACNNVCPSYPNSTPGCANSTCGISACTGAYLNCDLSLQNGCEINGGTDVKNCGKCGNVCPGVANGAVACAAGACGIGSCNAGFADCKNGYADGCETATTTDVNNCGACNNKCAVANGTPGCTASKCNIAACSAGFADCKNGYADGCETATTNDVNNCGACGKVCGAVANGTPGCANSACGVGSCNSGWANCDGNAANGCEVSTNNDPKNCGACGNVCASGQCVAGQCTGTVLIVGAPATGSWNNDVQSKLQATGAFTKVDIFAAAQATPTLALLKTYSAVLVYSDVGFADAATLGNNLADYFDAGGRVVVATFANASVPIQGRWASGNYQLINPAGQEQPAEAGALQIVDAASPLVTGVTKLTATAAYRSTGQPINGGVTVAKWGGGAPLIVRGVKNGVAYAALNFYPPSSTVRADFWAGDGATIMKNALLYHGYCHSIVGKNGAVCASGKLEYCDPAAPILATSAAQAQAACQACYGATCYQENADCAGLGYGPKPQGQYVCGDAYFGYAAGCSGGAGRIWSICSSNTTYGTWAP